MSKQSGPWHALYNTTRWQKIRRYQLAVHPLCKFCLERGIPVPAVVADHVVPHHGDRMKFFTGALQSLCEHCHNRTKKQIETLGYRRDIGLDGWPTDPRHPVFRKR
jgi:5-methylcytosine-specific restriction endonuclease McrA